MNAPRSRPLEGLLLLLPGILVAATGVGAGDLATAGFAGSKLGLGVFWAVVFGAAMKWVLNEGLARWQMGTGTTLLEAWIDRLHLRWVFVVYLVLWSFFVGGALISAAGVAATALVPLGDDPIVSKRIWGAIHALLAAGLVLAGGYRLFEKLMAVCIGVMFATVLYCAAVLVPEVDRSAITWVSPFDLDGESSGWVLGLIGGVGGTLTLLSYGYWIREAGRSGEEGVRRCRIDLAVGYTMTAFFGIAMLLIASTVTDLDGKGAQLIRVLGDRLGESVGDGLRLVFLIGAWGAIFSSMLGVYQSVPYMFVDFLRHAGWGRVPEQETDAPRSAAYRWFLVWLAVPPLVTLWIKFETIQLLYAVMGAFFMPLLAATLLVLNNHRRWLPARFRSKTWVNLFLVLTLLFFLWQAGVQLVARLS